MRHLSILRAQLPCGSIDLNGVVVWGEEGCGKRSFANLLHESFGGAKKPLVELGPESDILSSFAAARGGTLLFRDFHTFPYGLQIAISEHLSALGHDSGIIATSQVHPGLLMRSKHAFPQLVRRVSRTTVALESLRNLSKWLPTLFDELSQSEQRSPFAGVPKMSAVAFQIFAQYEWPGNIKELASALEYAHSEAGPHLIEPESLPPHILDAAYFTNDDEMVNRNQEAG